MPAPCTSTDEPCKCTDLRQLHIAIEWMDGLSQEGCSEIISISRLGLAFLERPDRLSDIETLAQAMQAIYSRAVAMKNDINDQACELGCGYIDSAAQRRSAVRQPT